MGRIRETVRDVVTVSARAVHRTPVPPVVYTHGLREARRPLPPGGVQKAHAIDLEMIDRTRCVWLDRHRADNGIIVHLHGGAFVSGPFAGDWEWLSRQTQALGCAGLMIDYRVAPDHTHPVALEDTEAVLAALADAGRLENPWVISGQNAGGGLALTVVRRLADEGGGASIPAPAGVVVMAPWLDLELDNTRISEAGRRDPYHERRMLEAAAASYAGRTPLADPELSPINADLSRISPLHLSVGTSDIFLTDVRVQKVRLVEQGIDVRYREISGRLGTLVRLRRGEDMRRLLTEQVAFLRDVLRPRSRR